LLRDARLGIAVYDKTQKNSGAACALHSNHSLRVREVPKGAIRLTEAQRLLDRAKTAAQTSPEVSFIQGKIMSEHKRTIEVPSALLDQLQNMARPATDAKLFQDPGGGTPPNPCGTNPPQPQLNAG